MYMFHLSFLFSRLRQNLREKHSRHVADLKAYYESEIQILRDKLKLRDLPQDLEKSNQTLTERLALTSSMYLLWYPRVFLYNTEKKAKSSATTNIFSYFTVFLSQILLQK